MEWLRYIAAFSQLGTAAWLVSIGSARRYRWFCAYSIFAGTISLALLQLRLSSHTYTLAWSAIQPILWLGQSAIAFEFYRLIRLHYPCGDQSVERRDDRFILLGALILGTTIAFIPSIVEMGRLPGEFGMGFWRDLNIILERIVTSGLALFLLAAVAFHSFFPNTIAPNVIRHGWFLAFFLTAMAAFHFAGIFWSPEQANLVCLPAVLACVIFWPLAFWKRGDPPFPVPGDPTAVNEAFARADRFLEFLRRQ